MEADPIAAGIAVAAVVALAVLYLARNLRS
jgi:hypothetical protein